MLQIPSAIYQFCVFMLLMRIGFKGGDELREAELSEMLIPAASAPTLRAGTSSANPSSYVGSTTAVGTPVAIALGIPLFIALKRVVFGP